MSPCSTKLGCRTGAVVVQGSFPVESFSQPVKPRKLVRRAGGRGLAMRLVGVGGVAVADRGPPWTGCHLLRGSRSGRGPARREKVAWTWSARLRTAAHAWHRSWAEGYKGLPDPCPDSCTAAPPDHRQHRPARASGRSSRMGLMIALRRWASDHAQGFVFPSPLAERERAVHAQDRVHDAELNGSAYAPIREAR